MSIIVKIYKKVFWKVFALIFIVAAKKLGAQLLKENTFRDNIENVVFNPSPD